VGVLLAIETCIDTDHNHHLPRHNPGLVEVLAAVVEQPGEHPSIFCLEAVGVEVVV
jgi:hypothetical protein